jgi:hypothetical protein
MRLNATLAGIAAGATKTGNEKLNVCQYNRIRTCSKKSHNRLRGLNHFFILFRQKRKRRPGMIPTGLPRELEDATTQTPAKDTGEDWRKSQDHDHPEVGSWLARLPGQPLPRNNGRIRLQLYSTGWLHIPGIGRRAHS